MLLHVMLLFAAIAIPHFPKVKNSDLFFKKLIKYFSFIRSSGGIPKKIRSFCLCSHSASDLLASLFCGMIMDPFPDVPAFLRVELCLMALFTLSTEKKVSHSSSLNQEGRTVSVPWRNVSRIPKTNNVGLRVNETEFKSRKFALIMDSSKSGSFL